MGVLESVGMRYQGITLDDAVRGLCNRDGRIIALSKSIRDVGIRLRYLASSADPKELEHELHALARQCEELWDGGLK